MLEINSNITRNTHTRTCVDHCWFDWMRTELRPGPLELRTVVSSARMMNVFRLRTTSYSTVRSTETHSYYIRRVSA